MRKTIDYLVVGAGLFGSVFANRMLKAGKSVIVAECKDHVGGNCFTYQDQETGINVHQYGTHVFHTNNEKVWKFINQFITFNTYQHKVFSLYKNRLYPMPINLQTLNMMNSELYKNNVQYTPQLTKDALEIINKLFNKDFRQFNNFKDIATCRVGKNAYEIFLKHYTIKQWGRNPSVLPATLLSRIPVRTTYESNYFTDKYQGIPVNGYTELFNKLLAGINVQLNLNHNEWQVLADRFNPKKILYTGPIDQLFEHDFGSLEWRGVEFDKVIFNTSDKFGTAVINYAEPEIEYTRSHEFKHLHPEKEYNSIKTVVYHERSYEYKATLYRLTNKIFPDYPVENNNTIDLLRRYRSRLLTDAKYSRFILGGRLGAYKYMNMDETIFSALKLSEFELLKNKTRK